MRLLLDHTIIHRIGRVLDSPNASAIRSIDALALFHIAEHILFAEEVIVSNFETNPLLERTARVLAKLAKLGVAEDESAPSVLRLEPFNEEEHYWACKNAGAGILEELTGLSGRGLTGLGRLADEAARPEGVTPLVLDNWYSDSNFLDASPERIAHLISLRVAGACELTVLECPPLFEALRDTRARPERTRKTQAAAIRAIMRIHINQQLANLRSAAYAPAPQRARISHVVDNLFRHKLERRIQEEVRRTGRRELQEFLSHLSGPDLLPLPLFVFHALRGKSLGSPWAILETARVMRDDPEILAIRKWLAQLEGRSLSMQGEDRSAALGELNRLGEDITNHLKGKRTAMWAHFPIFGVVAKPESLEIKMSLPVAELVDLFFRRNRRQRRFLAVVANELATDERLGARILQQLGRWPKG